MNRRERLENTIVGQQTDRVPVTLWQHFPGDDQRTADFAQSLVDFQQQYGWDLLVAQPNSTYQTIDYGLTCAWEGALTGDRTIQRHIIQRSLTWLDLRSLDPRRGETGKLSEALQLTCEGLATENDPAPLLLVVYSPLAQAARLAGESQLYRDLRTQPDRVRSGLNIITENTLRFIETLKRSGIAGICYVTEYADYDKLSEVEYSIFGLPYDRKLLSELPEGWWLNILSLRGHAPMFQVVQDYPVQAIQWETTPTTPDIPLGKSLIRGAVCGGVPAWGLLWRQSPSSVRTACHDAIRAANGRRLILSADGPLPIGTPYSNIRAVRRAVETI